MLCRGVRRGLARLLLYPDPKFAQAYEHIMGGSGD